MRHGTCFRRRLSTHHAGAAPHSAVAELGVVRRCSRFVKTQIKIFLGLMLLFSCYYGFRYIRYRTRVSHDTFSHHLATLAGPNAVSCGITPLAEYDSPPIARAISTAFADKKPFWSRQEREYFYFEVGVHEVVSEGIVFTPAGEVFRLERHAPTLSRPARVIQYRWTNPHLDTYKDGTTHLRYQNEDRVSVFTLDP